MILKKPLITEKMTAIMDKRGQYGFIVDPKSNKDEIKKAIEEFYGVEVASVNTMIHGGSRVVTDAQAKSPVILQSIKRPLSH